jgi:hypothetical protein
MVSVTFFEERDNPRTRALLRFDVDGHLLLLDQISIHVILGMPATGHERWGWTAPPVRKPRGSFREPRGRSRLSTENSLFAVFEPANMFLAVELDAQLFDELQLCFQKIDVLFFID